MPVGGSDGLAVFRRSYVSHIILADLSRCGCLLMSLVLELANLPAQNSRLLYRKAHSSLEFVADFLVFPFSLRFKSEFSER
jgi:hypothetical protein